MQERQKGVLVTHVAATSCSAGVLQPMDVLMEFDGTQARSPMHCLCISCCSEAASMVGMQITLKSGLVRRPGLI
jgi:hypothetical protein